ncbi:MAG: stage V sporulation protein SpoVM [Clostridia bacterium]|nr:stage V sporulation protein SpoVM [Clostridia bacterium]
MKIVTVKSPKILSPLLRLFLKGGKKKKQGDK